MKKWWFDRLTPEQERAIDRAWANVVDLEWMNEDERNAFNHRKRNETSREAQSVGAGAR